MDICALGLCRFHWCFGNFMSFPLCALGTHFHWWLLPSLLQTCNVKLQVNPGKYSFKSNTVNCFVVRKVNNRENPFHFFLNKIYLWISINVKNLKDYYHKYLISFNIQIWKISCYQFYKTIKIKLVSFKNVFARLCIID